VSVFSLLHGWRDAARLLNFAVRSRVEASDRRHTERVTILLPVLNESQRISPCLESLIAQPAEAAEILVVDGGSADGTQQIVERYHARDERVRLIDASPVDPSWTGKAWGLNLGLQAARSQWILCVDADVRASPQLVRSLLSHAMATGINSFSLATIQRLAGLGDALLHPAMLTTLIYRFGSPGRATQNIHRVLANGQCFISRRDILLGTGALLAARQSLCEDITIARRLAECGEAVGFYESVGIIDVSMYDTWRDTWRNWPRSLVMRDRYFDWHEWIGLWKIFCFQALPLPLFLLCGLFAFPYWVMFPAGMLTLVRLGILAGTARAYQRRPWTFWLSPLCDLPVALKLFASALARKHVWRGRAYVRRPGGRFEFAGHSHSRANPLRR